MLHKFTTSDSPTIPARLELKGDHLALSYDLSALTCPLAPVTTKKFVRKHQLWTQTCFECFLAMPNSPGYYELNFSTDGQWNAYAFEDYRQGMQESNIASPSKLSLSPKHVHIEAKLSSPLTLATFNLCCVIQDPSNHNLSYWAPQHPHATADFHKQQNWIKI